MSEMSDLRDVARNNGQIYFMHTKPCKNGHTSKRLVSNMICVECSKAYIKEYRNENYHKWIEYRENNRKVLAENARTYRKNNKDVISAKDVKRKKIKRQSDSLCALTHRLRSRMSVAYSGKLKPLATIKLIGCSFDEFKSYIQSKFQNGMTWDNRSEWHIDHIIPICSFNIENIDEAKRAFHYTNCQPLWAMDNLIKGKSINSDMLK